jgi:hypothetical protein
MGNRESRRQAPPNLDETESRPSSNSGGRMPSCLLRSTSSIGQLVEGERENEQEEKKPQKKKKKR